MLSTLGFVMFMLIEDKEQKVPARFQVLSPLIRVLMAQWSHKNILI